MNKRTKILIIIITLVVVLTLGANIVLGAGLVDTFKGSIQTDKYGTDELKNRGGKIVGMIQVVGTVIAVGMTTVIGIKYILGSAEEKAEYKKTMLPYLIGAVLIFSFSNITQVIYEWAIKI